MESAQREIQTAVASNSSIAAASAGSKFSVMVVAGEASSDEHAAGLVSHLKKLAPGVSVFGMGGKSLRSAGAELLVDIDTHAAVMGVVEVVGSLGRILEARKCLIEAARTRRPDLVIVVDYPDFNLSLVKALRPLGVKVLYFISPQLWAWRQGRVKTIQKYVDRVVCIFPFEKDFYQGHGVDVDYVGHPYSDRAPLTKSQEALRSEFGILQNSEVIALLPGSRRSEVSRLLLPMLQAFARLKKTYPNLQALIPIAPTLSEEWLEEQISNSQILTQSGVSRDSLHLITGRAREVLRAADVAVIASGTATVEGALSGTPFLTVYKLSPLTYVMAKLLVRGVKNFAMPNVIAGETIVPELLQGQVNGDDIANEVTKILSNTERKEKIKSALSGVAQKLSWTESADGHTAVERAAEVAYRLLNETKSPNSLSAIR